MSGTETQGASECLDWWLLLPNRPQQTVSSITCHQGSWSRTVGSDGRTPATAQSERSPQQRGHTVAACGRAVHMRGEAGIHVREPGEPSHRRDERSAERDMNAFGREYEEDHSWEELEEDEFGNLRPLVGGWAGGGGGHLSKQGGSPLEIGARRRACVACGEPQGPTLLPPAVPPRRTASRSSGRGASSCSAWWPAHASGAA